MAYTKQDWKNLPDQSTPISAARLNHLETQYEEGVAYTDEKIALNPGPQGPEGAPGPQGPEGPRGPEGPAGADGVPGADGADGPQGAQGPSGDPGATGPAGVISSASVTGLPPSAEPTISMGGTPSDRTFTFGIPKGEQGVPGADGTSVNVLGTLPGVGSLPASGEAGDAYIISGNLWVWSANSNDWTNAGPFQGPKGDTGTAGASATITSATATSLNPADAPTVVLGGSPSARTFAFGIPKGAPGAAGADGAAGTISSATATGLAAGAAPTVTLGGTPSSRTFAFGIPKGDKGDKGADGTNGIDGSNGTNGSDGAPGAPGAAGTITSASASGLAAGASPTITLGGTPNARTMAFGIPAGAKGEQGTPTTVNGKTGASITLTADDLGAQSKVVTNVADFGAVGNGTTDDTAALNSATNAAGVGGVVVLSPGKRYLVLGSVKLKSGTSVLGNGATLLKNSSSTSSVLLWNEMTSKGYGGGGRDITLRDLNVQGQYTGAGTGTDVVLSFMHLSGLRVENCNFSQGMANGHYLDLMGCDNVRISNSTFSGMNPVSGREIIEAIQIDCSTATAAGHSLFTDSFYDGLPTRNIQVKGCTFEPLKVGATTYPLPKPLGAHAGALVGDDGWYQDIWFENNLVRGWAPDIAGSYWQGWIQLPGSRNVTIRGNTFAYEGPARGSGRGSIISSRMLDKVTALENVASTSPPSTPLAQPRSAVNWLVADNHFTGFKDNYSDSTSAVIFMDAPHNDRISVTGNNCSDSKAPFLRIENDVNLIVSSNSAHITGTQGGVIQVSGSSASLTGNSVSGNCPFGILLNGGADSVVSSNKTTGCATGIQVNGLANGIVSGNYVADYTSIGVDIGSVPGVGTSWDLTLSGNRIRTSISTRTASIRIGPSATRLFRWGNRYRDGGPLLDTGASSISNTALDTN